MHKANRVLLGTVVEVIVPGRDQNARAADEAVFGELKRVEDMTSFHKPSELSRLNDKAGEGPVHVDPELLQLLAESVRFSRETRGTFDPTVGAVTKLWQFSAGEPRVPAPAEIQAALETVGWERVKIDNAAGTIELPDKGAALDLGGIAKGYALDRAAQNLRTLGITAALINGGGDVVAIGEKEPGKPWRVGVQDPRDPKGIAAVVTAKDQVVATSGDYERCLIADGKRYHHILDPKTGYPVEGMESVTIVGKEALTATILAKAVFIMGVAEGLKFLEGFPGYEAFLIDSDGKTHLSAGASKSIEVKGP